MSANKAFTGPDLRSLIGEPLKIQTPPIARDGLMVQAQALVAAIMELHGVDDDAAGLSLSAIRETGTGRILSVHLTPVDMIDGEAVPRYITQGFNKNDAASDELAERVAAEHLAEKRH